MALRKIKFFILILILFSCTKDTGRLKDESNYPENISKIIKTKCSVSGCHNSISKEAAAGLSLASWDEMFRGSRGGAVTIPFRPDFSTLCYYTNSFAEFGPSLSPTMPLGLDPLSKEEYIRLRDWIQSGAQDKNGTVKFAGNRSKLYITNQLCDVITVLDAESRFPMRYVDVGISGKKEFPVCVKVSPDGKYWYVSFLSSGVLQKFDALNDMYSGQADLGEGIWSSFDITSDSRFIFCADKNNPGKMACIDLDKMKVIHTYSSPDLVYPGSVAIHNALKKIYSGAETGNYITITRFSDTGLALVKHVVLDGTTTLDHSSVLAPTFLSIDEISNLCFIACSGAKEIKILDTQKDSLIGTVNLNSNPSFIDFSRDQGKLFVTCNDDSLSFPGNTGSVKVIDLKSKQLLKTINPGYQPNGILVNTAMNYAVVVNSNISSHGPKPHHIGNCSGRNGYVTFIELTALEVMKGKYELSVYPYFVTLKR